MKKYILLLILSIFSFNFNSNISANEVVNTTLEEEAKLLTDYDDLNISDITDGSNNDVDFTIQDYANSYIELLAEGEALCYIHI